MSEKQQARIPESLQHLTQAAGATNIVLKGVPESVGDAGVRALFAGAQGLPAISVQIVAARRLGQVPPGDPGRPRPVLVTFQSPAARTAAFRYSRHLRPFRLDDDLTPAQRAARRDLQEEFRSLRARGYSPLWRGATIVLPMKGALHPHAPGTVPPGGPPRDTTLPAAPKRGDAGLRAAPSPSELSGLGPRETIEAVGAVSRGSVGARPSTPRAAPARETEDAEESAVSHKKPAAGFALWSQLPTDVQRRILQSQGLSLRDLARVAPVSKLFSEALPLRFEEEDQWLSGVAPYVFGQHVVDFFLDWLPRTGRYKGIIDSSTPVVDLTKGDTLPTGDALLGLKSLVLKLPARGLSGGIQETVLTCHMFISRPSVQHLSPV
eukprot:jgi/Botrbrau1/17958/Bobra.50_1s0050.1